ncbi:phage holin family protein [Synechococcus sp. MIT S1220]|uniref:phage holin family protein n=1 Tax=Synechococcus sp. MIT S1220 TaxID=3082549 RepID=UPI0039B0D288
MNDSQSARGFGAAARVTALAASVMDLHVRMALQEVDREKRRVIGGALFLAMAGTALLLALLASQVALLLWIQEAWNVSLITALLLEATGNLILAGFAIRIGAQLLRGPFLPQTLDGLSKTFKAVLGK